MGTVYGPRLRPARYPNPTKLVVSLRKEGSELRIIDLPKTKAILDDNPVTGKSTVEIDSVSHYITDVIP